MMRNLYIAKPNKGTTISTYDYGVVTVLATRHYGKELQVMTRHGSVVTITRIENGFWCRARGEDAYYDSTGLPYVSDEEILVGG